MQSLDRDLQLFRNNYLLLEAFLTEAAQRLETIVRKTYSVSQQRQPFLTADVPSSSAMQHYLELNCRDPRLQDRRVLDALWLSVERYRWTLVRTVGLTISLLFCHRSYVISAVHDKVWPVLCQRCKKENQNCVSRCQSLRDSLTPAALGLPSDYHCQFPGCLQKLAGVATEPSPLDKLYSLQEALVGVVTWHNGCGHSPLVVHRTR